MLMDYDSLLVKVNNKSDTLEVTDKIGWNTNFFSKGIYRFDQNKTLRFYGFYINDSTYKYSEEYDNLGNLINYEGNTLLEYRIIKGNNDSVIFNGFISSFRKHYSGIDIIINSEDTFHIELLYKSNLYSNVKCFSFKYKGHKKASNLNIITIMSFINTCTDKSYTLFDTTIIPIHNLNHPSYLTVEQYFFAKSL
jgi:hypothetical protein